MTASGLWRALQWSTDPRRFHAVTARSLQTPSNANTQWKLRDVLLLVACAALGGAVAETGVILGARLALGRIFPFNPQGIWLAPLGNALLILPTVLLVWALARRRRPAWAFPAAVTLALFFALLEPFLLIQPRVHGLALTILAAGSAAKVGSLVHEHPRIARRTLRWLTSALAVVVLLGALGFNGTRAWRERHSLGRLGAAPEGAPNVLLLVLDTVRALSLSVYGYARPTAPSLERLAARGVTFDRAVATASWTLPTHASLFTGRYAFELSASYTTPLDSTFPTLAERLTSLGYQTSGFGANLRYTTYEYGLTRGFGYFRDYEVSLREMIRTSTLTRTFALWAARQPKGYNAAGRVSGARMNERFFEWLDNDDRRDPARPFFTFMNLYDAHAPYDPPAPYDTIFLGRQPSTRDSETRGFTAAEVADLLDAYDGSLTYLDSQLGTLFEGLQRRGLLENTIVIVTADHGEEFKEHGQMNHGNTLYFPSLHVPLIFAGGAIPHGQRVLEPVTLRDVAATVLNLVRAPATAQLPGASLSRYWSTRRDSLGPAPASPIFAELDYARNLPPLLPVSKGVLKSVVVDGYHYIRDAEDVEELYDIVNDPWERQNVVTQPSLAGTLQRARVLVTYALENDVRRGDMPYYPRP
jgi:arylsulfatase A-like enzyme